MCKAEQYSSQGLERETSQISKEYHQDMKRTLLTAGPVFGVVAGILSLMAVAPSLTAQTAPAAKAAATLPAASDVAAPTGPAKIGTMNFEASVLYTNEGQRDFGELQKKFQPRKDKLEAENAEIESLKKQLQANGEKLADDERASRVRAIEAKQKDLQRASEDFQNDAQAEQQQAFQKIAAKVADYVATYGQENGYTAILEVGSQTSSVIWAVPSVDVTRAIIAGYNAKSGVPAPPPGTAPATPTKRPAAAKPAPAPAK
jgi:outer membrane protein